MGALSTVDRAVDNLQAQARAFFEPQLRQLDLGRDQIEKQALEELRQSLERANDALKNPEQFGVLRIALSASGVPFIAKSTTEALITVGILPILLERKQLILDRIRLLEGDEKLESLRDLISKVSQPEVKEKLDQELRELEEESHKWEEQATQIGEAKAAEELRVQADLSRLSAELFERRSKVWLQILGRESVATMLGGLLLLIIIFAEIAAFMAGKDVPDILDNCLLVILGYFFGQTAARAKSQNSE